MIHYQTTHETETSRVRWVYDTEYSPEDSWGLPEPDNSIAIENEKKELESGNFVALGAIVETKCEKCGNWDQYDSLWGIIVNVDDDLKEIGDYQLNFPNS